ncbi:M16 family metallopeptidase [Pseudomonas fontis]|uniref:Insulinase family protein n=1 Tax=Pseudomonas fontis TaxID=2942633 RepID=A0ABT5NRV3_9PSED|nr:pitrilysin family protein [Pseudomonas fontis]MDD0973613.1 insulinase family protein [Pseudomonas fontis]MDD0990910.1 insulinase family protein [Pseudomonas fontis]
MNRCFPLLAFALLTLISGASASALTSLQAAPPLSPLPPLPIQAWQTAQGARVLFMPSRHLPMFDLQVTFAAGSGRNTSAFGLAGLTLSMLDEGTRSHAAEQIAEAFDASAARFDKTLDRERATLTLRSLSRQAPREAAVAQFVELLGEPTFPPDRLALVQDQFFNRLQALATSDKYRASEQLYHHLYAGHPFAAPLHGTVEHLAGLDVADLSDFYQRHFSASNALIVLVGDLSDAQARQIAERVSNALPQGPAQSAMALPTRQDAEIYQLDGLGNQAHLLFGLPAVAADDPDLPALTVANLILGGNVSSRLIEQVRNRHGLSYDPYSELTSHSTSGLWTLQANVEARYQQATMELIHNLLETFANEGPTEQEFDDARQYLRGTLLLNAVSNEDIARHLRDIGFNHLPLDQRGHLLEAVQKLTLDQLKVVLKKHLVLDRLVQVGVGPTVAQEPLPSPGGE